MDKFELNEQIKKIITEYLEDLYQKYLDDNKILLINNVDIKNILKDLYENNIKFGKQKIRDELKKNYLENYQSSLVENIIFDIFQDKDINIDKLTKQIELMQKKNYKEFIIPIVDNTLNINISIINNNIVINKTNNKNIENNIEMYHEISNYKFIYSVNTINNDNDNNDNLLLFHNYNDNEKIQKLKEFITNKKEIKIAVYYLKN